MFYTCYPLLLGALTISSIVNYTIVFRFESASISDSTPLHSSGIVDTLFLSQYSNFQVFLKIGFLVFPLNLFSTEVFPPLIPQAFAQLITVSKNFIYPHIIFF